MYETSTKTNMQFLGVLLKGLWVHALSSWNLFSPLKNVIIPALFDAQVFGKAQRLIMHVKMVFFP